MSNSVCVCGKMPKSVTYYLNGPKEKNSFAEFNKKQDT